MTDKKKRKYIDIDDVIYIVKKYDPDKKLKKGCAYIIKEWGIVLPYIGKTKDIKAGIYKSKKLGYYPVRPFDDSEYRIENVYEIDTKDFVSKLIREDGLRDSKRDIIIAESGEIFAPMIEDGDNILQKLLKMGLSDKQIVLKSYASRFKSPTDVSNHRKALISKLSISKFDKWTDVLDFEYEIIMRDKKGCSYPTGKVYRITSRD